jgi:predicted DsbA family dithiol-disulfide isomerase
LLRPERPPEGEERRLFEGETQTELSPEMRERASGVGLIMRRPQWSSNTLRAHEATIYAKTHRKDGEFHHSVAEAYWASGADINGLDVLERIVEASGMDWSDLRPRIESGEFRAEVMEEYEAAKGLGVTGTPAYMIGGGLYKGDVGIDQLREAIKSASAG